ncbi:cell division protein FtsL [Neobacillus mesonae]|uniref:cell division protein FtsL n=1 Tax=Neobacillus mesonae TaxID=1193713 RepID=UPI002573612B|nr:cell division protein FtsL [Neobacillus mesonae]MED4202683.1 cell division protein FtsL [Neobacillus mesonae]
MSNLARKMQQQQQRVEQPNQKERQIKLKKSWLTPGEKIMGVAFAGLVCFGAVHLITNQATIYQMNKEIQNVETKINEQKKVNADLQVQVKDLSNYERIYKEAKKMGLDRNNDNVKVVPAQ